jgi:tRNA-binding protein
MSDRKPETDLETFQALDIRAGTVVRAEPFPEARKPAIKLWVDFGDPVGVLQSSARLNRRYTPGELVGTPVVGVVNFPPLRVAGFRSECLVLGVLNPDDPEDVVLVRPDDPETGGWPLG